MNVIHSSVGEPVCRGWGFLMGLKSGQLLQDKSIVLINEENKKILGQINLFKKIFFWLLLQFYTF